MIFSKTVVWKLGSIVDKHAHTDNNDRKVPLWEVKTYLDHETTYQSCRRFSRDQHATVSGDLKTVLSAYWGEGVCWVLQKKQRKDNVDT